MKLRVRIIFYLLIGIPIFMILLVVLLSVKEENQLNGFKRFFLNDSPLARRYVLDLGRNSFYLAGFDQDRIYLGNFSQPRLIIATNYVLADTQHIYFNVPQPEKMAWRALKASVVSRQVFLSEGITPVMLQATFANLKYVQSAINIPFNLYIPIGSEMFALRTYDSRLKQSSLIKASLIPGSFQVSSYVLEKQIDGFFCADGTLLYNSHLNQIVYVYAYRNQFVILDSDLHELSKTCTIDTTSHAKIHVENISSENKMLLVGKPPFVNYTACTYKNFLFIHSAIKSDNESVSDFNSGSVVDLYNLREQKYVGSFYLPDFQNIKMTEFTVFDNRIVARYMRYIVIYDTPSMIVRAMV